MDENIRKAIFEAVQREPFAQAMGLRLLELGDGYSLVEMMYQPEHMDNIYERAHGGAIFALIDEGFETAAQTDGTVAVALNVNVTYVAGPKPDQLVRAETRRISQTKKTATYDIKVVDQQGKTLSVCQALAYRTGKPIPFL